MYYLWDEQKKFPEFEEMKAIEGLKHVKVHEAIEGEYQFLLGAAITKYNGTLYSSWGNSWRGENDDMDIILILKFLIVIVLSAIIFFVLRSVNANKKVELYSYDTLVLTLENKEYNLNYNIEEKLLFSKTTLRHIIEFLKQFYYIHNLTIKNKKDVIKYNKLNYKEGV